ncbi:MCE family protein [Mycobacterium avium subsp. hominissuis]|uniref:MCE-family protein MCE1A n=6 Tax=Mycobacterium avium TaxID=1764 RepID=A0A2A2ZD99_MYCAV|nr:MCE family protein [Mycobacterium avium]ETB01493.1 MCE-family protein MCE1A [Mycobacterium avium 10-5581]ATO64806.2 MCE family protein [Mycobacterium avium subsp. hominissuis]ATO69373.1 MCE family protein [Mycobacterium avium subsp. hominissuis]ATO73898.2 MCE family protein [Mycobacterium avium subsp. hominissuis]ETZ57909.1 mce related family protein [Mycobacterium avium MAV_120709_2344]
MARPVQTNAPRTPPYKLAGLAILVVGALALALIYGQFRGNFTPKTSLTMLASRAGLVMDPGSKVTYNGVEIGRVGTISETVRDGKPAAKFTLEVYPRYLKLIPSNVNADIKATTVFGGKYVSLTTPANPSPQKITPHTIIDARSVTTEINTLFQTITSIAEKVDPVKLNLTLSAAAQSLSGLGEKFGQSVVNANVLLDDVNPRMPQARKDIQGLAALGDTYADASPDLFDFLNNAVITSRTINAQQKDLDRALLSAAGFGNTGADLFTKGGPYLARGAQDLVPSAQLLDTYSPELFCTVRNYHDIVPITGASEGGFNGYSLNMNTEVTSGLGLLLNPVATIPVLASLVGGIAGLVGGAPNPYIYPENLPRVNARGGPGGAPGCWQPITHDLWPAPELVIDSGNSLAPYNHLDTGSPYAIEYVWGRQVGDNTINP